MGRKYIIHNQIQPYFVTFTVVNWIDAFIRDSYRMIFVESIRYCQKEKGLQVHAWVIMTNHIHLIVSTAGNHRLEDIIRDLKSYTSKQIRLELENSNYESRKDWMLWMFQREGIKNKRNTDFQFWIQDNHPVELITPEFTNQKGTIYTIIL